MCFYRHICIYVCIYTYMYNVYVYLYTCVYSYVLAMMGTCTHATTMHAYYMHVQQQYHVYNIYDARMSMHHNVWYSSNTCAWVEIECTFFYCLTCYVGSLGSFPPTTVFMQMFSFYTCMFMSIHVSSHVISNLQLLHVCLN